MDKNDLRKNILSDRKKLTNKTITEKSDKIVSYIINSEYFKKAVNITCYYPYKNEVNLVWLMNFSNKKLLFPRVVEGSRKLDFYAANSLCDFEKGAYGIMEPKKSLPIVDLNEIDLFLTPGTAFSRKGERIGYGGGFYDTTLQFKNRNSKIVGICFDLQIVASGFADEWDRKVDELITESGFVHLKN
ncbi:MAG: 5-formyltetrahydrofolate cyclo-ligase [bacterium]|nr:5-formyltetrahydrofolate cyclo-ligase [bacterium]